MIYLHNFCAFKFKLVFSKIVATYDKLLAIEMTIFINASDTKKLTIVEVNYIDYCLNCVLSLSTDCLQYFLLLFGSKIGLAF